MLKRLAIAGLLILGCGAWPQVPGNGSKQHNNAQDKQETANPSKPVVGVDSPHSANNQEHPPEKPTKYPWGELLAPANIPNWFLVVVGAVTGWFVYKTLRAIKKQADLMDKQIALQSSAMRQWVNVVPLGIGIPHTLEIPREITLQFEILNKTDYLVTIKGVEFELIPNIHSIGKFKVDCDFALAPRKSENESAFPFAGKCAVDIGELDGSGKIFIVAGDVKFLDCMDREQVQHFQDLYRGFIDGRLERMRPSSIKSKEDQSEGQNPN